MKQNLHRVRRSASACLTIATVLVGLLLQAGVAQAASLKSCHPTWKKVSSDDFWRDGNFLTAATALSPTDAWAVGGYLDVEGGVYYSGALHWDGTRFSDTFSQNPGYQDFLDGVAAVSSNDVWAVGAYDASQTLIEHWNGTSWSVISSPNTSSNDGLAGVAVISTNDSWAVGGDGANHTPLIEHWDGSSWSTIASPGPGSLNGVAALSSNDVWAVGGSNGSSALIEHWDGSSWSIVPNPGSGVLDSVAALSATDIWAVGGTLIEHWNGTSWSVVPGAGTTGVNAVTAVSHKSVWAAGTRCCGSKFLVPLIEHWNGTRWSVSLASNAAQNNMYGFGGIAAVPNSTEVFAVGATSDIYQYNIDTLVYLYAC
jgi:hypothetical protein